MDESEYSYTSSPKQLKLSDDITQCLSQQSLTGQFAKQQNSLNYDINPAQSSTSGIVVPSNHELSDIFNLNIDCFNELFDYLSLQDLSSFGQTCKKFQKFTGEYFKRNYFAYEFDHRKGNGLYGNEICMIDKSKRDGCKTVRVSVSVFQSYLSQLSQFHTATGLISNLVVKNIENFSSLKQMNFCCLDLNRPSYEHFKNLLKQLEIINTFRCIPFEGDFYEKFLKYCDGLKRLGVTECDLGQTRVFDDGTSAYEYPWLRRKYPKLEHLKLIPRKYVKIDEINEFLTNNLNVRSFSTSAHCFWVNRHQFLTSKVKLDSLEIWMNIVYDPPADAFGALPTRMQTIVTLLNKLHERGFYKELKMHIYDETHPTIDEVASMRGLEKLSIVHFKAEFNELPLTLVKELSILRGVKNINLENLAERCVRLEQLELGAHSVDDILPFICRSSKLKRIKAFENIKDTFSIDIVKLNDEREKLAETKKVVIYVPDDVFLRTKWKARHGDLNLNWVELRRSDSWKFAS